jgi:L-lactate dehydrogenase complex protein LldE
MKVALFMPCYIDQFYPQVGIATLQLLEKHGCEVHFPLNQTCCGQPMANSGFEHLTQGCNDNFIANFKDFDYIVCPSGSCTLHVKEHIAPPAPDGGAKIQVKNSLTAQPDSKINIYELTEFLVDVLKVENLSARFGHRVGLHQSCHGQRGLHLSQMSELNAAPFSKPEQLLNQVTDLELVTLIRKDECCGFGGTFCVFEEAVSVKMGKDRIADHTAQNVEYITATDTSCLMHLEGILKRQGSSIKTIHIAEILNS